MRYFKTSNASRPYNAGGLAFTFEPVDQIGGSWLGVLAVEESAASTLTSGGFPQVTEITEEEYSGIKKKPVKPSSGFYEVQPPQQASRQGPVVPSAEKPLESPASPELLPEPKSARIDPPDELAKATPVKALKPARKP